jgi:hypothetical protein
MKRRILVGIVLSVGWLAPLMAQEREEDMELEPHQIDSVEWRKEQALWPPKVYHAEPLYIDLIRDLGARKGEREWNVGMGLTDKTKYDSYEFLVEYEWAPIDRLGLEIEVPVTVYTRNKLEGLNNTRPADRIESLKMAFQYTFLVSTKHKTSLAIGGITEILFNDLNRISWRKPNEGLLFNPFFIGAKDLGSNWHSLIYTGPRITREFGSGRVYHAYEINSNLHYIIPGSRNFIGIEFNKLMDAHDFEMVMRPQMRLVINDDIMIGIVTGIPLSKEQERLSTFFRLIYEPKGKH